MPAAITPPLQVALPRHPNDLVLQHLVLAASI
jgi:hypothetical protein